MPKRSLNLYLDEEVVAKAEKFSAEHETSISKLVNDFLSRLPSSADPSEERWTPAVRRLVGAARGGDLEDYRTYLRDKYGS